MKFIVSDQKGNKASIITDNKTAIVEGEGYIADILKNILKRKQLTRIGQIKKFPEHLKRINNNGITELKTESIEFLENYLPSICKNFNLEVTKE